MSRLRRRGSTVKFTTTTASRPQTEFNRLTTFCCSLLPLSFSFLFVSFALLQTLTGPQQFQFLHASLVSSAHLQFNILFGSWIMFSIPLSLGHIFWVPYFISVSGTKKKYANSCLQHTNGAKSSEHFVNVFCFIQIPNLCTLRQMICEYNITDYTQYHSWVVLQVQFSIHFRHGSVINSTQISVRTACLSAHWQREAAIVVISLSSCLHIWGLSELTVLTLSARTSTSEYVSTYLHIHKCTWQMQSLKKRWQPAGRMRVE